MACLALPARRLRGRNPIGENDTWIAAFALTYREPLVSRDTEFDHVVTAGLPLVLLRF